MFRDTISQKKEKGKKEDNFRLMSVDRKLKSMNFGIPLKAEGHVFMN
jgi:hypothetical protein